MKRRSARIHECARALTELAHELLLRAERAQVAPTLRSIARAKEAVTHPRLIYAQSQGPSGPDLVAVTSSSATWRTTRARIWAPLESPSVGACAGFSAMLLLRLDPQLGCAAPREDACHTREPPSAMPAPELSSAPMLQS